MGCVERALANEQVTMKTVSSKQNKTSKNFAREAYLACAFLLGADRNQYGKLIKEIENNYIQGQDGYPKTVTTAYNLSCWRQNPQNLMQVRVYGVAWGWGAFLKFVCFLVH